MKYRLDSQHYIDDKLLEPMFEIGDGTPVPYRDDKGHPRPPSRAMTPLDDEAKRLFEKEFGTTKPEVDPTKKIPVMGNVKETGNFQPPVKQQANPQPNPAPVALKDADKPHNPSAPPKDKD